VPARGCSAPSRGSPKRSQRGPRPRRRGRAQRRRLGWLKAPVEGDVHLHLVEVAREADDVDVLPPVAFVFASFCLGALEFPPSTAHEWPSSPSRPRPRARAQRLRRQSRIADTCYRAR
jgi:hypothetical protein